MTTTRDVPAGGADSAADFVESPKLVNMEAEARPDFDELNSIEKKRREILLRVSLICLIFWTDMHTSVTNNNVHHVSTGWASILEDLDVLERNMLEGDLDG